MSAFYIINLSIFSLILIYSSNELEYNFNTTISENDKVLTFRLTQEDTLKLDEKVPAEMQVRAKTNTGTAPASNVVEISVGKILKEGII